MAGRTRHIVFAVTRADDLGGAQVHVRDLSLALAERGWKVTILAGSEGPLSNDVQNRGLPFRTIPHLVRSVSPVADVRAVAELRAALRQLQPDLLSLHSSKAGVLGRLSALKLGFPVLLTAHGWGFSSASNPLAERAYRLIERTMSPLADRIIAVSEADRRLALRFDLAEPSQIVTIHNGMPDIAPSLIADAAARPTHVVMVARFAPPKDHELLLTALADLHESDWNLSLIGGGPLEEGVRRRVDELGLRSRVSFLGFRRDVDRILATAQLFVLTSRSEAFPRSILEAARAGLPTIASDVGGIREAVLDGQTGFVVPAGDRGALRARLDQLIGDGSLRAEMGRRARARFEEHFTLEHMVTRTVEVYEDLLGSRASRPSSSREHPGAPHAD